LSFRDNAATRGDFAGTIPVISFTGMNYTGNTSLEVTLKQLGTVIMGLRAINAAGDYSMFEMEWHIVA
jgi:hypothetical protein